MLWRPRIGRPHADAEKHEEKHLKQNTSSPINSISIFSAVPVQQSPAHLNFLAMPPRLPVRAPSERRHRAGKFEEVGQSDNNEHHRWGENHRVLEFAHLLEHEGPADSRHQADDGGYDKGAQEAADKMPRRQSVGDGRRRIASATTSPSASPSADSRVTVTSRFRGMPECRSIGRITGGAGVATTAPTKTAVIHGTRSETEPAASPTQGTRSRPRTSASLRSPVRLSNCAREARSPLQKESPPARSP